MNQNLPEPSQKKWIPDGFHFLGPEDSKDRRIILETVSGILKKKAIRKYSYLHLIIVQRFYRRFPLQILRLCFESEIFPEMKFHLVSI